MSQARTNNLNEQLYRFGGNKPALLIALLALLLGAITALGALTLEDQPVCVPAYAGSGQPNGPGQVIAGQITERDQRLDGCQEIAIRVVGHSLSKYEANRETYNSAATQTSADTVLVLRDMPARYQGLAVGTKIMALYNPDKEAPLALFLPEATVNGAGLELGSDTRADYGRVRLILYLVAALLLFTGASVLALARMYPVKARGALPASLRTAPRPAKVRRPPADPITGERPDDPPRPARFALKSEGRSGGLQEGPPGGLPPDFED